MLAKLMAAQGLDVDVKHEDIIPAEQNMRVSLASQLLRHRYQDIAGTFDE